MLTIYELNYTIANFTKNPYSELFLNEKDAVKALEKKYRELFNRNDILNLRYDSFTRDLIWTENGDEHYMTINIRMAR